MRKIAVFAALLALAIAGNAAATTWSWDCDVDPTTLDSNDDKVMDWVVRGSVNPGSFDMDNINAEGHWLGGHTLDTRPLNDFIANTSVEIKWKCTATGDWQACFWMNIDADKKGTEEVTDDTFSPIYCFLEDMDGSQRLTIHNIQKPWNEENYDVIIAQFSDLPADFITVKLDVNTKDDKLTVSIDGQLKGTYTYVAWGPANYDMFATVLGSAIVLDSVKILVKDLPTPGDVNLDCKVNILDLIFIRNRLNQDPATGDNWQADVNADGKINILDLIAVRNALNTTCD